MESMPAEDPVLDAFARAPVGEPLSPEQRAELDQMMADIDAGKVALVPHADVREWVLQNGSEDSEFAAE